VNLPANLKNSQQNHTKVDHLNNLHFNKTVHMDIFSDATDTGPAILTLMDENTAYSISTVILAKNHNNLVQTLTNNWFNKFGLPREIHLKEGKVKVSQLAQRINKLTPTTTVTCKNWSTIFNTEIKHQWRLTRPQLLEEDFVNAVNFFQQYLVSGTR
jgi:hypothetical protein